MPNSEVRLNGSNQIFSNNTLNGSFSNLICVGSNNNLLYNNIEGSLGRGLTSTGSYNLIYGNILNSQSSITISGNWNFVSKNSLTNNILTVKGANNTICGNMLANVGFNVVVVGNNNIFYANNLASIVNDNQQPTSRISLGDDVQDASSNLFYENNFIDYGYFPILVSSGVLGSEFFDNGTVGNYWTNYNGTDADNNDVGDTPYNIPATYPRNNNDQIGQTFMVLVDNYPSMNAFVISSVNIQLPSWTNITVPNPLSMPTFPPQKTASPTSSTTPSVPEFQAWTIPILLILMVSTSLLVYFKKHKR